MATNLLRGGGKLFKVEVTGVRELQLNLRALIRDLGVEEQIVAKAEAYEVIADAADSIRDVARRNARSQGWPDQVVDAIFSFKDFSKAKTKKQKAAMVGIRTGAPPHLELHTRQQKGLYVEWFPGRSKSTRAKSLVLPGTKSAKGDGSLQKVGMSLGRMFESGTSKMKARPAFRPAVLSERGNVLAKIRAGLGAIVARYNNAA